VPFVRVIKPETLSLLTRPFEFRREFWLGVAVLAFVPIGDTPVLLPEAAMWRFLSEELPTDLPLDAAIPKVCAEFLAVAHCHAPDGVAAPLVRTGIQLGPLIKLLDVHGDRMLDQRTRGISKAVPFEHMPIDWSNAYGGPGFADNPLGKSLLATDDPSGSVAVHNILNPRLGRDGARVPVSYGPVDQAWPSRARFAGTYDDTWLKQDFPGFAGDIDWRFFNAASADQWLAEPLKGDETCAFKNLHPQQKLLKGRLPGMAPRLFLVRRSDAGSFEEVPLSLTTVWFFPHRERMALVHHGRARIVQEDASDIARVVVGADLLNALRPADEFRAVMVKRADTKGRGVHALRDADLVPEQLLPPAATESVAEPEGPARAIARARKRAEREYAAARTTMRARGLDPDKYGPPELPPDKPAPTLEELPAFAEAAFAEIEAEKAKALTDSEARKAEAAAKMAEAGMPEDEIQKRLNPKLQGPPAFNAAAVRTQMAAQITAMRVFGQVTLPLEQQLASPDFGAVLESAEQAARDGYRLAAHHQAATDALPAERSSEIRRLVAADAAAARARYDLHGADLSGLDLSGVDLSGVCLDSADLSGTSLAGAKLINAVLAHARMDRCILDGADLSGASVGKARLIGASLRGAALKAAVLAGADLTNASLAGADLEGADLSDIVTVGTDFSEVHAPQILAMKLSLPGLRAPGIVLTKARFLECNLQGADLTGAALERAVFLNCNLAGIRLGRARLRKAVFVNQCSLLGAHLAGADLSGANLRQTDLRGANLNRANLEQADLSGADLSNAVMQLARGTGSRLVAADLQGADLRLGDFAKADFTRADLRGANLTGMSVYEANLPRTRLDPGTRRGGMFRTRMRYLPVYQAPEEAGA
jgi:uncharacterized protein YjbI with pentapeptide repeats